MAIYTGASGADSFSGTGADDSFYGGDGDDHLYGRGGADYFEDGSDSDHVYGGNGDDLFNNIGGGSDHWFGGSGRDLLITNVTGFPSNGLIVGFNAKTGFHGRLNSDVGQDEIKSIEDFTVIGDWDSHVTGTKAHNQFITDAGQDTLFGGGGHDALIANGNKDKLYGGNGNDALFGGGGADVLRGGSGGDEIYGGTGKDVLFGGGGADYFVFTKVSHSKNANPDVIRDFKVGVDIIGLWLIDDDLSYIGNEGFSGTAGEVRVTQNGAGDTIVRLDKNGDGASNFRIIIDGVTGLTDADFSL